MSGPDVARQINGEGPEGAEGEQEERDAGQRADQYAGDDGVDDSLDGDDSLVPHRAHRVVDRLGNLIRPVAHCRSLGAPDSGEPTQASLPTNLPTVSTVKGSSPALRAVASVVAGVLLAGLAGLVLGEYPFVGDGIQWLPIMGGAGVGAVMAWTVNRIWSGSPPIWMAPMAAALAAWGEVLAVQEDTPKGVAWPVEGWAAIAAAAVVAGYGVWAAGRQGSQA